MIHLAITGLPACGKSSLCQILETQGFAVFASDQAIHNLYQQTDVITEITKVMPAANQSGRIEKTTIRQMIQQNPAYLTILEDIFHPYLPSLYQDFQKQHQYTMTEIPLLCEKNWQHFFTHTISLTTGVAICRQRFYHRNPNRDPGFFDLLLKRHFSETQKTNLTDYHIDNSATLQSSQEAITTLVKTIIETI